MKAKILFLMLASGILVLAAWLVRDPNSVRADEIPEKYRETVSKGLEYLVKNQCEDGHWEGDGGKHPVAMTGLVGLALVMERKKAIARFGDVSYSAGKYSAQIRKAADWLIAASTAERDGLIYSNHSSETARYMEGHGLATLFLAGICMDEKDDTRRKKLSDTLTRAVKYIVKARSTQGGWYHTSKVEGHDFDDVSATVMQIQALQAAEFAGVPVPGEVIKDAQEYLKKAVEKHEKEAKAGQNPGRASDTAAALVCRLNSCSRHQINSRLSVDKDALCTNWLKYCQAEFAPGRDIQLGRDELAYYYYSQALFIVSGFGADGTAWQDYRTATFDFLKSKQNKDGSWPTSDGIGVGSVYSTAVWCVIFQLDNNSHPSMQRSPDSIDIT